MRFAEQPGLGEPRASALRCFAARSFLAPGATGGLPARVYSEGGLFLDSGAVGQSARGSPRSLLSLSAVAAILLAACVARGEQAGPPAPKAPQPAAQDPGAAARDEKIAESDRRLEAEMAAAEKAKADEKGAPAKPPVAEPPRQLNYLELLKSGGPLMYPIAFMSLMTVTLAVERALALRRNKVLPPELIAGLGKLASQPGGLDPRAAYRLCQQFPSAAASVFRAMLLKVGRPHTEVEQAVSDASDREAGRLYGNVRWLNLAAGVTPLLGLLGTVQGMILAFFVTANLQAGENKAQKLAEGIYMALVTTFAGLCVAIPAAIVAHFCEGQIEKLFRELHETILGLSPQLEKFEGRLRVTPDQLEPAAAEPPPAPPAAPRGRPAAAK